LLCGLAFAILVAILEFCWNSKKNAQNDRQSLCSEMAEELRFAIRCHQSKFEFCLFGRKYTNAKLFFGYLFVRLEAKASTKTKLREMQSCRSAHLRPIIIRSASSFWGNLIHMTEFL
jgi:hypothetical protein